MAKKFIRPGTWKVVVPYDQKGSEVTWVGIVRALQEGVYDLTVEAVHTAPNTRGRVIVKAIAGNGAQVKLSGMIKIYKEAQGTDNFLELRVLILDDKSRATADPQLEIETNEVKAGHGASVSKIDEEQLLYLMGRGMSQAQAQEKIVEGFLLT